MSATIISSCLQQRVDDLSSGPYGEKWKGCKVYKDYRAMLDKTSSEAKPDAMIIGVPPWLHGQHCHPGVKCARSVHFTHYHLDEE